MPHYHDDADAQEQATAKRKKETDAYNNRLNAIADESISHGNGMTRKGNMRRHVMRQGDPLLATTAGSGIDITTAFLATHGSTPLFNSIKEMWAFFGSAFNAYAPNKPDPARYIELLNNDEFSYIYHTAMISPKVMEKLNAEIAEIRALETEAHKLYDAGQYGPFHQHFQIGQLKDLYEMRMHPETGDIAFSQSRVHTLQAQMNCTSSTCPVTVFRPVSTSSLRGLHVKAADPTSDNAVKVTTSDQAVERAAAPPIRVTPPQLNYVH